MLTQMASFPTGSKNVNNIGRVHQLPPSNLVMWLYTVVKIVAPVECQNHSSGWKLQSCQQY